MILLIFLIILLTFLIYLIFCWLYSRLDYLELDWILTTTQYVLQNIDIVGFLVDFVDFFIDFVDFLWICWHFLSFCWFFWFFIFQKPEYNRGSIFLWNQVFFILKKYITVKHSVGFKLISIFHSKTTIFENRKRKNDCLVSPAGRNSNGACVQFKGIFTIRNLSSLH